LELCHADTADVHEFNLKGLYTKSPKLTKIYYAFISKRDLLHNRLSAGNITKYDLEAIC